MDAAVICLGTSHFGSSINVENARRLMDRYLEMGGNFLDTANVYGDWIPNEKSLSEKTIGQWLKDRKNRHQIILSTKGGHPDLGTMHISRLSPKEIIFDLEQSLNHLQTDYIDIYWLHRDDPSRPVSEMIDLLNTLVRSGKVRYIGCSNWTIRRIAQANQYASEHGLQGFAANQLEWSLAIELSESGPDRATMNDETRKYHEQTGLPAVAYHSQAGGFFSGRYPIETLAELAKSDNKIRKYYCPENIARLARVNQLVSQGNYNGTQIALAYLLSKSFPAYPIIGPRTVEQLEVSCSASELMLDEATVRFLEGESSSIFGWQLTNP